MDDKVRKSRMEESAPGPGKELSEKQREQLEKKDEAEHATGEEKEAAIDKAKELD